MSVDGANQVITGTATDAVGSSVSASATINLDQTPPLATISSPSDGSVTTSATVPIQVLASDATSGVALVSCNGVPAVSNGGSFNCTLAITQGVLQITVQVVDVAGNTGTTKISVTLKGPDLTIISPAPLDLFAIRTVDVSGTVDDAAAVVTVNGVAATNSGGIFTAQGVSLQEGSNLITATGVNSGGGVGTASVSVTLDTTAPTVRIDSPANGAVLTSPQIYVTGLVNDVVSGTINSGQVSITVNGVPAQISNRSFMAEDILLVPGRNVITAVARDRAGNISQNQVTVTLQDVATQQHILMVSGNGQSGAIGTTLPLPLVVQLVNALGQPMVNVPVTFALNKSDGVLNAFPQQGRQITIATDGNGQAASSLVLGTRVGSGNNQVLVTSQGFSGEVMFCETAVEGPPTQIHVISDAVQKGVAGQPLPEAFVAGVFDAGGNPVAGVPVVFSVQNGHGTVEGQTTATKVTDSDGHAAVVMVLDQQPGINNNSASASFTGLTGAPAVFTATGLSPSNAANTVVTGIVLDNADHPVPNARASIQGSNLSAFSDAEGRFTITDAPVGSIILFIDGSTSTRPETFPFLEFPLVTVSGQDNHLDGPIYLPPLDMQNSKVVGGDEDVLLTMAGVPGVVYKVFAHSATFPDGSKVGRLTLSQVHADKVPMAPPNGTAPRVVGTLQPARVKFDPPIQIQVPNTEALLPGQVVEVYSFDHDLEQFVSGGTARVSEDGSVIISDPGFGLRVSGWHAAPPPPPPKSKPKKDPCDQSANDAQQMADDNQGFFNPTTEFMDVQACIAKDACRKKKAMDNPNWLDQVLPKFVNALKDQTGAWPVIIAACNAIPITDLFRKQECAAMMATNHIFVDLLNAMTQAGCGTDSDWQSVQDSILKCLQQEDPLLSPVTFPITKFLRDTARGICQDRRQKLGLPLDGNPL